MPYRTAISERCMAIKNKPDGFRTLARREVDRVELLSRAGRAIDACFPEIPAARSPAGTSIRIRALAAAMRVWSS